MVRTGQSASRCDDTPTRSSLTKPALSRSAHTHTQCSHSHSLLTRSPTLLYNMELLRCIAALLALLAAMGHPDPTLDQHWQLWKKAHGKAYRHQVWGEVGRGGAAAAPGVDVWGGVWFQIEEGQRRATWEKNLRLVTLHNLEHSLGLHSYQLGMNHMGDMVRGAVGWQGEP